MTDEGRIEVVDPGSGDVFADEAVDFDIVNGTLRIRFAVAKPSASILPANQRLVHIGRLIMPIESAQRLSVGLYNILKNAGYDPSKAIAGEATRQ